jgi:acetyl esterase/lipase
MTLMTTSTTSLRSFGLLALSGALFLAGPKAARAADRAPPAPAPAPEIKATFKVKEALDIRYAPVGGDRHELDVFSPEVKLKGGKKSPVVVLVHGGAWMIGDKNLFGLYRGVARALARQGLVVVVPNYRLTPWVRHPEHVKDLASAFAWVRGHIADYGGDRDDIFLCGHSAGGHLVALLATDDRYLKDPALGLTDEDRQAIRGVIGVSGVYNIPQSRDIAGVMQGMLSTLTATGDPRAAKGASMPAMPALPTPSTSTLRKVGFFLNPFQLVFGTDRAQHRLASPLSHVRPGLPPFLLFHAERELPLLADMARDFGAALKKAGNDAEVVRVAGRNHNSVLFWATSSDDPVNQAIMKFVARHRRS